MKFLSKDTHSLGRKPLLCGGVDSDPVREVVSSADLLRTTSADDSWSLAEQGTLTSEGRVQVLLSLFAACRIRQCQIQRSVAATLLK